MIFGDTVKDKVSGETAIVFATVKGTDYFAVSVKGGATKFYCPLHQRVFSTKQNCPDCEVK